MGRFSMALVHHPVLHKDGSVISSAITNTDLHDITRTATTYAVDAFYIVTPVESQRLLAERLIHHWTRGDGAKKNADRQRAFGVMHVTATLQDALAAEGARCEGGVDAWASSAQLLPGAISLAQGRERLLGPRGGMLVLGTAHGLAPAAIALCAVRLAPLPGVPQANGETYNHLSVRAAAAILVHELRGPRPAA